MHNLCACNVIMTGVQQMQILDIGVSNRHDTHGFSMTTESVGSMISTWCSFT